MHTILGAGGPVANILTKELINHNETIRLVSRKPVNTNNNNKVTWQKADLLNYDEVLAAAKGSTVIYLVAGLVYDKDIWRAQWPVIMQNVINVTKATGARLIFFDNVYMYGLVNGTMTEDTPYKPNSAKGEVRAAIAEMLMNEVKAGNIRATIARAPDFYGTDSTNSFIDMLVLSNYAKKQNANGLAILIVNTILFMCPMRVKPCFCLVKIRIATTRYGTSLLRLPSPVNSFWLLPPGFIGLSPNIHALTR